MSEIVVNKLPVKTWNRLGMNEVTLDAPEVPEDVTEVSVDGADEARLLSYKFDEGKSFAGVVKINVKENTNNTIVMDFLSDEMGYASVKTEISMEHKSRLTLVQVHRLGESFRIVNHVGADLDRGAVFELVHIFIRGKEIYAEAEAELRGEGSELKINTGYLTTSDHILDMNYVSRHIGEKTSSDISVMGALCDKAEKRFRGTIDFKRGAVGAKGDEVESVLLMDDGVVNKTIPIILCEEEEVEGNHGATIGRLDEETLYYMKSRGLDEETIRKIMRTAYVDAVCRQIPDETFRERLMREEGLVDA